MCTIIIIISIIFVYPSLLTLYLWTIREKGIGERDGLIKRMATDFSPLLKICFS